jgi:uncharacterized protein
VKKSLVILSREDDEGSRRRRPQPHRDGRRILRSFAVCAAQDDTSEENAMAALTDKVRADMTEAMKAQEKERLSTLRMLQSALKNEQINVGHELSDEEAMTVIRKAMKQRQDSIEQFTNAGRTEMAEKERVEMELLKTYLPAELTAEELENGIREIIASTGAQSKKDLGKVMKEATARFKGRVDGKKVQEVVSRLLP